MGECFPHTLNLPSPSSLYLRPPSSSLPRLLLSIPPLNFLLERQNPSPKLATACDLSPHSNPSPPPGAAAHSSIGPSPDWSNNERLSCFAIPLPNGAFFRPPLPGERGERGEVRVAGSVIWKGHEVAS